MNWRFGPVDVARAPRWLRRFSPNRIAPSIDAIDLDALHDAGKRLILLDVDNTLVQWHEEEYAPEIVDWVERAHAMGFEMCILSNTRRPARLQRIATFFRVDSLNGRFKPHPSMYREALRRFGRRPEEAIMIGDQLMTDVLGANRAGVDSIWLRPIATREFFGTKFNRAIESVIRPQLFKMMTMTDVVAPAPSSDFRRQITRFVVVGGTSFVIDYVLTSILMKWVHVGDSLLSQRVGEWVMSSVPLASGHFESSLKAAAPVLGGLASFVAMFNSFYWNRKWTFGAHEDGRTLTQLRRFYTVSILGACWNALIFGFVFNRFAANVRGAVLAAKVVAAGVVAVWNFLGQRHYAFRGSQS